MMPGGVLSLLEIAIVNIGGACFIRVCHLAVVQ